MAVLSRAISIQGYTNGAISNSIRKKKECQNKLDVLINIIPLTPTNGTIGTNGSTKVTIGTDVTICCRKTFVGGTEIIPNEARDWECFRLALLCGWTSCKGGCFNIIMITIMSNIYQNLPCKNM